MNGNNPSQASSSLPNHNDHFSSQGMGLDETAASTTSNDDHAPHSTQGYNSASFLDSNWSNSLFMDQNHNLLYDMEFPAHIEGATRANNIVQSIQYQNNVSPDLTSMNTDDGSNLTTPLDEIKPKIRQKPSQADQQQRPVSYNSQVPIQANNVSPPGIQNALPQGTAPSTDKNTKSKARRPCDHCRRRKTKCVLIPGTNNCVQCEAKSLSCTFIGQAVKRKPVDVPDEETIKRFKERETMLSNRIVAPNVPIRDVAPVQDYSAISNSLLKKTLSLQFPRSSFYIGPSSFIYDNNLLNLIIDSQNKQRSNGNSGKIEQINLSDSISLRKVSEDAQFVLKDDQSPLSYQTMSNDVDTVEKFVAPHGQILIDLYFRIVHPSYPILHKKVFLEKYSRTHREFSAPLLAAVYVLAIQWWDYDPSLNRFPKPNVEVILKLGLNNYLLEILKRPKLSAVQAGLLLLQCKHIVRVSKTNLENEANQANTSSVNQSINELGYSDWVLCSQVISLAEELGLGLNCMDWKLPKWERGLRKRLAWAVYIEDKWLALKNARPSHIHPSNWVVTSLAEEDFPEKHGDGDLKEGSSDIDNGKKIFKSLISLSMILSDILDSFYSMKAMEELKADVNEVLKLAKPIQLRLRNWYHSLPAELLMSSVQPRKLCSNGYLHLAYFATELTLHRKIITLIHNTTSAGNAPPAELSNVCREAAKTRLLAAINFVRDLKPEHIHSFWHSSSASNFTLIGTFASILYISAQSNEESVFFRDQIFNYRWILKISSKGFDQVGDALLQLDLVLNHIPGLLSENSDLPMILPTVQDMPIQRPDSAHSHRQVSASSIGPFNMTSPNMPIPPKAQRTNSNLNVTKSQRGESRYEPSITQQGNQEYSPHSSQASPTDNRVRHSPSIEPHSPVNTRSKPSSPLVNQSNMKIKTEE